MNLTSVLYRGTRLTAATLIGVLAGVAVTTPASAADPDYRIRHVDATRDVGAWLVADGKVNATAGSRAGAKIDAAVPGVTYRVRGLGLFRVTAVTLASSLPSKTAADGKVGWDLRLHTVGSDRFLFLDRI